MRVVEEAVTAAELLEWMALWRIEAEEAQAVEDELRAEAMRRSVLGDR